MQPSIVYCSRCGKVNQPQASYCFHCGAAMQIGALLARQATGRIPPGQVLNQRYRIVKLAGQGGMGAVYQAEDLKFGARLVALKEMSQSNLSPQEIIEATERFEQEAQLLAGLKHPNLPSIYDYFSESGNCYLVMDFIEGKTLDEYLKNTRILAPMEVLEIGIQLSKTLGYLHNRPSQIIFRDLKPLNVMITPEENIYLIDFGIARLFKVGKTKDTISYVSAGYAAPEQYGQAQTSPQSDIYSLGATLHQLLSGSNPGFNSPLFTFKPLSSYNLNIPIALSDLVMNMVNIDPTLRPANMLVVKQNLERILMQLKQNYSPLPTQYPPIYTPRPTFTPPPNSYYAASEKQVQQAKQLVNLPLPKHRVLKTLLIGIVTGALIVLPRVFINMDYAFEESVFLSFLYYFVVPIFGCLIGGIITGRKVLSRRMGFLTGAIVGLLFVALSLYSFDAYGKFDIIALYYAIIYNRTSNIYLIIFPGVGSVIGFIGACLAMIKKKS